MPTETFKNSALLVEYTQLNQPIVVEHYGGHFLVVFSILFKRVDSCFSIRIPINIKIVTFIVYELRYFVLFIHWVLLKLLLELC